MGITKKLITTTPKLMTKPYIDNVFPMLRQLCAIVRIDCSHRTTKNRREKETYEVFDPKTKKLVTKV